MKSQLQSLLRAALEPLLSAAGVAMPAAITVDAAKDEKNGDFASNIALTLAKPLGKPPRAVAEAIVAALPRSALLGRVEIAGPGFINFFLTPAAFQAIVPTILEAGERFGRDDSGSTGRVLIEFVSANPTGPIHVGHGRGAAYGDALANMMQASGWQVWREYYINDAGRQVDVLTVSAWARYLEACGAAWFAFPKRGYPGDYVRASAARLREEWGDGAFRVDPDAVSLPPDGQAAEGADEAARDAAKAQQERYLDALIGVARAHLSHAGFEAIRTRALDDQLAQIRSTLDAFGVHFDRWTSEKEFVTSGGVERALEKLDADGLTVVRDGALWFDAMRFGDDKPRVLKKSDGASTYFCNDLAYHVDKLARGWPLLLDVWGADHHGYIARMKAAIEALSGQRAALQVQLIQFVTLSSGRMGKRSGNFVTLQDLIDEAGRDATRFFYLSRSHDQHLEFDIELARSQTNDNPVFYVQMAHARVSGVLRQAAEREIAVEHEVARVDLSPLTEVQEKSLLSLLGRYPETLRSAAANAAPHLMTFYLRELADALHRWYAAHAFLVEDTGLRNARLTLARATRQVLRNGLLLIGVSAPDRM